MCFFQQALHYDYIWACRDGLIPTPSEFYHDLVTAIEDGADYIVVDSLYRNNYRYCYKKYTDCLEFFADNSARTTILGSIIFKSKALNRILSHYPLNDSNYSFWTPIAPLHEMAAGPFCAVLIISTVFIGNPIVPAKSFWNSNILRVWTECWYKDVSALPEVYQPAKAGALRIQMSDFHPFYLKSMLSLRAGGGFNLFVYKAHKKILPELSDMPEWKFYFAALVPRSFARFALWVSKCADSRPQFFLSRYVHKLYDIYIRLGR